MGAERWQLEGYSEGSANRQRESAGTPQRVDINPQGGSGGGVGWGWDWGGVGRGHLHTLLDEQRHVQYVLACLEWHEPQEEVRDRLCAHLAHPLDDADDLRRRRLSGVDLRL